MKIENSEVSFEKRGKLEDHQCCPVCKCCICWCGGHRHFRYARILFILAFLLLPFHFVSAQTEIHYTVQKIALDFQNPTIVDINKNRDLLVDIFGLSGGAYVVPQKGRKRPIEIACPGSLIGETQPHKLGNQQDVSGECSIGNAIVGFLRQRSGAYDFIHFPGADHTRVWPSQRHGLRSSLHAVRSYD